MRFMVIVKASKDSEAGVMPSTELLTAMGKFNEEMVEGGRHAGGRGPASRVRKVRGSNIRARSALSAAVRSTLTGDLVAGFWLIQVKSLDEAIDWMKRAPFDGGSEIEIRQVFSPEDFGEALTPELREQEARLRAQARRNSDGRHPGFTFHAPGMAALKDIAMRFMMLMIPERLRDGGAGHHAAGRSRRRDDEIQRGAERGRRADHARRPASAIGRARGCRSPAASRW